MAIAATCLGRGGLIFDIIAVAALTVVAAHLSLLFFLVELLCVHGLLFQKGLQIGLRLTATLLGDVALASAAL